MAQSEISRRKKKKDDHQFDSNADQEANKNHQFIIHVDDDPTKDPKYDLKQYLLEECKKLLGTTLSGKRPLNIAVLGPPGCGKSAFLNTVFASFSNDRWREHAKHGSFSALGKQVTTRLKSYRKEVYYRETDTVLLPTFIDMTGFENEDSELNRELLNIILKGKMKENELLSDVIEYGKKYREYALRMKYSTRPVYKRVDRIIVVCSCNPLSNLPHSLFETIAEIASNKDITVYGVMTHADAFSTEDKIKEREAKFRHLLGIPDTRFVRIMNYCSEVDLTHAYLKTVIPTLDVPVLRLMTQFNTTKGLFNYFRR
ncbi:SPG7 [Mytilus coruscus]|uniref:SPG7 n=1 Tax=Mytilus coruscus TaxID=42192 RepID=A0A6J8CST6_MYTCO|nr:SPG7 [Mytilus coruscus]